jgi:hypothetical protein
MNSKHLVLMAAFAALASCSDDDPKEKSANVNAYCEAVCGRTHECDNTQDQVTCTNSCKNSTAATAPKLRSDYVSALQACVLAKDCASMLTGDAIYACAEEVNASIAPSPAGTDFCTAWEANSTRCGSTLDKAGCLDIVKQYNDAALREAQSCTDKECTVMDSCVGAALGADVGGGGGSNSCQYAYDGFCDEPDLCTTGTDSADCGRL